MAPDRLFDIMKSVSTLRHQFLTSFSAKRFDVNILDRSRTEHFFMQNTVILA